MQGSTRGITQWAACAALCVTVTWAGSALAQAQPRSWAASPDVYKVLAEGPQFKVIQVIWKPGQRDEMHSHPASAVYYLTDCTLRNSFADGTVREGSPKAGMAITQPPIAGHTIENIGSSDCKLIMFEPV